MVSTSHLWTSHTHYKRSIATRKIEPIIAYIYVTYILMAISCTIGKQCLHPWQWNTQSNQ